MKSYDDEQAEHSTWRGSRTTEHRECRRGTERIRMWKRGREALLL
jgi:hypothetical protein